MSEATDYASQGNAVQKNLLWPRTTFTSECRGVVQTSPNGIKHLVLDSDLEKIATWLRQGSYKFNIIDGCITVTQLPPR